MSAEQQVEVCRSLPHGHVAAVLGVLRDLDLERLLCRERCRERDLCVAMICQRLIAPCSKLSTTRLVHQTTLAQEASRLDAHFRRVRHKRGIRYMTDHFPPGMNDASDARLLFDERRTSLVKDDARGPRVPITHGQSGAHRARDPHGRLCLNLEHMWAELERSVDRFIAPRLFAVRSC